MRCLLALALLAVAVALESKATDAKTAAAVKTSAGFSVASASKGPAGELLQAKEASEAGAEEGEQAQEAEDNQEAMPQEEIDEIMKAADSNKDGKLSWEEVLVHAKAERQAEIDEAKKDTTNTPDEASLIAWDDESEKQLKELFTNSDANKDGVLEAAELPALSEGEAEDEEEQGKDGEQEEREGEEGEGEEGEEPESREEHEKREAQGEHEQAQPTSLLEQGEGEHEEEDDEGDEQNHGQDEEHGQEEGEEARDPDEDMKTFLNKADTNKDGKLSLDEIKAAVKEDGKQEGEEGTAAASATETGADTDANIEAEFKAADKNHDGFLDADELKAMSKEMQEHDAEGHASLMEQEGDGDKPAVSTNNQAVTKEELRASFDNLDSNKDGKITWQDIEAGLNKAETSKKLPAVLDVKMIKKDFKVADKDEDGLLSFEDFAYLVKFVIGQMGDNAKDLVPKFLAATSATI